MNLYVITAKGPYALEIRIVRAPNAEVINREFIPAITNDCFTSYKVEQLSVEGKTEEVFQVHHVE